MNKLEGKEAPNLSSLSVELLLYAQQNGTDSPLARQLFDFIGQVQRAKNDIISANASFLGNRPQKSENEIPKETKQDQKKETEVPEVQKLNKLTQEIFRKCHFLLPENLQ
jgi:hypothetical protein